MRRQELLHGLNAGGVDPEATARVDMEKLRLAGEHPVANLIPRVLGPSTLRPGSENLLRIPGDAQVRQVRFLRSIGTSYILLLTANEMRVSLNGVIQQVPAVSTAIGYGSWSDVSTAPAAATGGSSLTLNATTTAPARLRQAVSVAGGDQAKTNILRVVVSRGVVYLSVGTTAGGKDILSDVELETGTHKIGFVPNAATIYVEISATEAVTRTVSEIQFESALIGGAGDLVLPTPWNWTQVGKVRSWQSVDVLFAGDGGSQQRVIQHRGPLSWGIALYKTDNGPFIPGQTSISLTPGALTGNTTVTASDGMFKTGHVGALLELTQTSKTVQQTFTGADQVSDYVTIIGVTNGRIFYRTGVSSSFVGTVTLERSFDATDPSNWTKFATYVDGAVAFSRTSVDDDQDNLTVHYRFRVSAYTSGQCTMTLEYESGVQVGRARIVGYTNPTTVDVEILRNFGNTNATRNWRIGDWSDVRGWPRVPMIDDDRMHWFRNDTDYGAYVSDYYDYDDTAEGDSAPITRSVGTGGQDGVLWATSEGRLLVGTASFEAVIAASELDEPLSPTRYTVRKISRRGCSDIEAVSHDDGAFFVQRSGRRLYEVSRSAEVNRYATQDVSRLNPLAYSAGILQIAVQQQPDTRVYAVMSDGTMTVLTYNREDKVVAVTTMTISGGLVESVEVLPNTTQDDVYLIVNRSGQRYQERLAPEAEQRSKSTCALLDGHKVLTGSVSAITGGTHLAGQTVQVWADGQRRSDVTLDGSGYASLGATYARVVYGLRHYGSFKSVKLAYGAQLGTALGQTKIVRGAGLILSSSCLDGIRVGRDASHVDPLPLMVDGVARTTNQLFDHYDQEIMPISSEWDPDARIYIKVDSAEGPCTIQGVVLDIETRDGVESGNG